ncbi:MAG: hypothetical protein U0800_01000 [Isosphaeraceae bacterium]
MPKPDREWKARCVRMPASGRRPLASMAILVALAATGCATVREPTPNPLPLPVSDFEPVWNATVAVLDEYFEIANEDRVSGEIVTNPVIGSDFVTFWAGDSVGFQERLESTMQTIRRFARARVEPAPGGGFLVRVEVYKELEDIGRAEKQVGGRATFNVDYNAARTREVVGPTPMPVGWIPRGRDPKLEDQILRRIRTALFL